MLGGGLCLSIALSACGATPAVPVAHRSDPVAPAVPVAVESNAVQSLQKQLREREKRIEELESQLSILKMIDQDLDVRRKPARIPATLTPNE